MQVRRGRVGSEQAAHGRLQQVADPGRAGSQSHAEPCGGPRIGSDEGQPQVRAEALGHGAHQRPPRGGRGRDGEVRRLGQQGEVVVLDHQHVRMAGEHAAQFAGALLAQAAAGGVLRPWCAQHRLGAIGQRRFQRLRAHAVRIHGHGHRCQARAVQDVEAAEEARVLHRHLVAGDEVGSQQTLDRIDRTMRQHQTVTLPEIRSEPLPRQPFECRVEYRLAIQRGPVAAGCQRLQWIGQPGRVRIAAGQIRQRRAGLQALLLTETRRWPDHRSVAPQRLGNACGHQLPIRGGDRVAVDAQLIGHLAHGRQGLARGKLARMCLAANALEDVRCGLFCHSRLSRDNVYFVL